LANIYLEHTHEKQSLDDAFSKKFGIKLDEEAVNQKVRMVVVASKMDASTERIIDYLRQFNIDINILFFSVFNCNSERLISRAWLKDDIEVASAASQTSSREWNHEFYVSFGQFENDRQWNDAMCYGFVSAGGGAWYTQTLRMLKEGDRIWVNIPKKGYVGVGEVISEPLLAVEAEFEVNGSLVKFHDLQLKGNYITDSADPNVNEQLVKVRWIKSFSEKSAVKEIGFFGNQNTVCRPVSDKWDFTVKRLKEIWKIEE
jgi:hypothetical protein